MANQGGSQHGIARTSRVRTEAQRQRDLERIASYRVLEDDLRARVKNPRTAYADRASAQHVFDLTTRLLRLNPEYYTVWNIRRRALLVLLPAGPKARRGGLCCCGMPGSSLRHSSGSSCLMESSSTCPCGTTTDCCDRSSCSCLGETQPSHGCPKAGRSGTTADDAGDHTSEENDEEKKQDDEETEKQTRTMLQTELEFTIPLLIESPKCYWIWSYRLWILRQSISRLPVPVARGIWQAELALASKMLTKDRRNFHAWGYRRHVVAQLESDALGGGSMVEAEFQYTEDKIRADLSNFSAWHSRSKLIPRLLEERGADEKARREFFEAELDKIHNALNVGPEDQSLWYYHQYLMLNLTTLPPNNEHTITPTLPIEDRIAFLRNELAEIRDLLEDYDNVKLIYEALIDLTLDLCRLEGKRKPDEEEKENLREWLGKMKELDPMRMGRWRDFEEGLRREWGVEA